MNFEQLLNDGRGGEHASRLVPYGVDHRDAKGNTALHFLIQQRPDLLPQYFNGMRSTHNPYGTGAGPQVTQLAYAFNGAQQTAYHLAAASPKHDVWNLLVQHAGPLSAAVLEAQMVATLGTSNGPTMAGNVKPTFLPLLATSRNVKALQEVLSAFPELEQHLGTVVDREYRPLLHVMASATVRENASAAFAMLQLLLSKLPNPVNAVMALDNSRRSALHHAAAAGVGQCFALLLDTCAPSLAHGAHLPAVVFATDSQQQNVFHLAVNSKVSDEAAVILLDRASDSELARVADSVVGPLVSLRRCDALKVLLEKTKLSDSAKIVSNGGQQPTTIYHQTRDFEVLSLLLTLGGPPPVAVALSAGLIQHICEQNFAADQMAALMACLSGVLDGCTRENALAILKFAMQRRCAPLFAEIWKRFPDCVLGPADESTEADGSFMRQAHQCMSPGAYGDADDSLWRALCEVRTTPDGRTPLHVAAAFGHHNTFVWLWDQLPDALRSVVDAPGQVAPAVVDADGTSPLMWAASNNRLPLMQSMTKMLAEHNCLGSLEGTNPRRQTPLHLSAGAGNVEMARFLGHTHPALLFVRDSSLRLPSDVASDATHRRLAKLLIRMEEQYAGVSSPVTAPGFSGAVLSSGVKRYEFTERRGEADDLPAAASGADCPRCTAYAIRCQAIELQALGFDSALKEMTLRAASAEARAAGLADELIHAQQQILALTARAEVAETKSADLATRLEHQAHLGAIAASSVSLLDRAEQSRLSSRYAVAQDAHLVRPIEWDEVCSATDNFDDRYVLATGGQAKVYMNAFNGVKAVFKMFDGQSEWSASSFTNEMNTLGRLSHRRLVPLLGYSTGPAGQQCIVYEAKSIHNLEARLLRHAPSNDDLPPILTVLQRLRIAVHILQGVVYLHEHNVVHRDLHPGNVLLGDTCEAFLGDFGIARVLSEGTVTRPRLVKGCADTSVSNHEVFARVGVLQASRVTVVTGVRSYVDPLVFVNGVCWETDIYAVGLVLLQLLSSKPAEDVVDRLFALGVSCSSLVAERPSARTALAEVEELYDIVARLTQPVV